MQSASGNPAAQETAVLARAPWWRRGVRSGVAMGLLALAAILLLNEEELPGLGHVLTELPASVAVSVAVYLPQILLTTIAWRSLLPLGLRPPARTMAQLRWFRESANALLPAGALVGQVAAARLLTRRGVPADLAGATATMDMTLETVSQFVFTLAAAIVMAQRHLGLLERLMVLLARRWPALHPEWIGRLQREILRLHTDWRSLAGALFWHSAAWALGAFEIMGVLGLLGHPVSLADALVIESLAQALRNAGFMLPGALAVQEGAMVGAAALVGVPPAAALAAALVRRTREVAAALPGLMAWHRFELAGTRAAAR